MDTFSSFINNKEKTNSSKNDKYEKKEVTNKLIHYNKTARSENNKSDSLNFDDKINFYGVAKKNAINYMTPIKVNDVKYSNKNKKNTKSENDINNNNRNIYDELSNLFNNTSAEHKNIMVSELDIELSDSHSNSNSNFFTDYKNNGMKMAGSNEENKFSNINTIKKRELDFKKEIEQNLKKFLKHNEETINVGKNNHINERENENEIKVKDKDNNIIEMNKFKKKSHDINYCLTDFNKKSNKFKNIKNSFINLKNKLNFYHPYTNYSNFNFSYKYQTENNTKNNMNKKNNEFFKINLPLKRMKKSNNKK